VKIRTIIVAKMVLRIILMMEKGIERAKMGKLEWG